MRFRASEIAEVTGGAVEGLDAEIDGASIDSRQLRPGQLFVALRGDRDGHDFVDAALSAGAPVCLTARGGFAGTTVVVDDPAGALSALGAVARDRLPAPVVGITGSVGKTTTKDLVAAAVASSRRVHASDRSFNNELGVPLTLLDASDDTEVTVVEMGARGKGHIAALCDIARPTIGVVTAVELVHAELFGDLAAVADAKGELVEALPPDGTAVLNADNPLVSGMGARTQADVVTFGLRKGDVRAEGVTVDDELRPSFEVVSPWGSSVVRLETRGVHNVANALAAVAVALAIGVELAEAVPGLQQATTSPWRMEMTRTKSGTIVLNDAYNAGPASTEAALRALAQLPATRRIAVLGVMAELGEHSAREHRRIGAIADELGIDVIAVDAAAYGARNATDIDAVRTMLGTLGPDDAVLVKGSRVAGLEVLVQRLLAPPTW